MLRIIRNHNRLAGPKFSLVEFLVMTVVLLGIAVSLGLAGRFPVAVIPLGIAANCLAVAAAASADLRAGMPDRNLGAAFSPAARAEVLTDHPQAQRDTWVLAGLTLVPFLAAAGLLAHRYQAG